MPAATATAHPNIALVKYWGKRNRALNLPSTPSLSLTLDEYRTRSTVTWGANKDRVVLNGRDADGKASDRVLRFLDLVAPRRPACEVVSENNFPTAAGLASSSSAFAALALAACAAAGLDRDRRSLSALARRGSGSACRSLWGGWVQWLPGTADDGSDSHGHPLVGPEHWDVRLVVAMASDGPKSVGSTEGMIRTERTSPFYGGWVASAERDLDQARQALLDRDLASLGAVMERSTLKMHATMLSAEPPIRYWTPRTLAALDAVEALRADGVGAWYTMDAGPNVKVLCLAADAPAVAEALGGVVGRAEILAPGGEPTVERS